MKKLKPRENLLLAGPYWLLQIWLHAISEPSLQINIPNDEVEEIKNRQIKGTRLSLMTPTSTRRTTQKAFTEYFMMFAKCHTFTPTIPPFA